MTYRVAPDDYMIIQHPLQPFVAIVFVGERQESASAWNGELTRWCLIKWLGILGLCTFLRYLGLRVSSGDI